MYIYIFFSFFFLVLTATHKRCAFVGSNGAKRLATFSKWSRGGNPIVKFALQWEFRKGRKFRSRDVSSGKLIKNQFVRNNTLSFH